MNWILVKVKRKKSGTMNLFHSVLCSITTLILFSNASFATTYPVNSNQNWSAFVTTPTSSDSIIVRNGAVLTVNVTNAACKAIQLGDNTAGGNKGNGTLTFTNTSILTISGKVYLGDGTKTGTLTMISGGTLKCQGISVSTTAAYTSNGTIELTATNTLPTATVLTFDTLIINHVSGITTLGANITINGKLTLSSGKLAINGKTLTLNGDFSGSSSNYLSGSNTSNLTISGSGPIGNLFFDPSSSSDTSLGTLTINRSGQTITLGNTLKIITALVPTAGTLATGGNLILESTASGTARIENGACTTGCSYISGNVKVRRYIPSQGRRWRFLSSPVTNATLADLQNEMYITGNGGASNGFDATASNQSSVYWYDESAITGDLNTGWTAPSANTDAITAGKGYRFFIRGDRSDTGRLTGANATQNAVTLDFIGTVNAGNVNLNPTFTSSGDTANDGWNLVGNPYASPVDWNAFHDAGRTGSSPDFSGTDYSHLYPIAYIFDAGTNSYVSYNAVTNAGTGSFNTGIIPSGASFFVKAPASSPAMTMKENYKSTSTGAAVFKQPNEPAYFSIKLNQDSVTSDEMVIIYKNDATPKLDVYDIPKLYGADVNIAGIGSDSTFQSLVCKPLIGISDTIRLSAGFRKSGNYSLEFNLANNLIPDEYYSIKLLDAFDSTLNDLRTMSHYDFTVDLLNSVTYGNNRFLIVIGMKEKPNLGIDQALPATDINFQLYPNIIRENAVLHSSKSIQRPLDISLMDCSGRKVILNNTYQLSLNQLSLDLRELKSGLYFIRIDDTTNNKYWVLKCVKE